MKKVKIVYSIVSFMLLLYGIFLMIYPKIGIQWIYKIGGILFIGIGIAKVIGYFSKDLLQLAFQHDLAMGIVSIVIGILMLMWTKDMIRILTICLGLFMLMEALLKIQTAIDARQIGMKSWWLILIIGLITAVIGGLLAAAPLRGTRLIIRVIGLTILAYGVMNLYVVQNTVNTFRRDYTIEIYGKENEQHRKEK
ncbi:HdeD family acid-resistance protein [Coprococcus sp. AF21-14LB]|uniref:HdeD family acid-resistance protein n=1 Tax=Coprococcus sp. AF21-14LB TaxID=2292231 RepID=UPI0011C16551|nr:DUF308 domain-containing protein [Coprococcus sp. AF21-14LB]